MNVQKIMLIRFFTLKNNASAFVHLQHFVNLHGKKYFYITGKIIKNH